MKLTPHPILLSLSSRLLQVTVAISPPAAKGASKGRFSAHIRSEGPPQANAGFRNRARGELQRQNKKFYQSEGTADFREKGAFCRESSLLATFLNAAFVGGPSVLSKTRKQRSAFFENLSARVCGWLRLRGSVAAKTKKSGTMLKTGISRAQLGVASDKPPAAFNA